ncbi:hypothetical protein NUSPORA_00469 [Nucleospora cyclopteri]
MENETTQRKKRHFQNRYYDNKEEKDHEDIFVEKLNNLNQFSIELNDTIKSQNIKLEKLNKPFQNSIGKIKKSLLALHRTCDKRFKSFYYYTMAFIMIFFFFFFLFMVL